MKMYQCISTKTIFIVCIFFLCWGLSSGSASSSESKGGDDFQKQYRAYQGYARSGYTAFQKKEYSKAIEHYTKAIEMSPFVASHYYYRGLAWYRKGDTERTIEDLDKVIILDPRHTNAYIYRGLCRMIRSECAEALRDYKSAMKLKPKDSSIHNNLAWLYATAKDEKFRDKGKALKHAKKAAELSKERNAEILDTLARAYFINGKINEAIATENKALKLKPYNDGFKENLKIYQKAMKE
jgi:tetratricopeptide (TPR) repeat protein